MRVKKQADRQKNRGSMKKAKNKSENHLETRESIKHPKVYRIQQKQF